jgi:hypothetical protein
MTTAGLVFATHNSLLLLYMENATETILAGNELTLKREKKGEQSRIVRLFQLSLLQLVEPKYVLVDFHQHMGLHHTVTNFARKYRRNSDLLRNL